MEPNLIEEEQKDLEKLQHIRVKFLRFVHRLGLSPDESLTAQVLHRLLVLGGRQNNQIFNLDAAKNKALQLEAEESDDLDFSVNILVIGKSGVGKSATINSLFGMEKTSINTFETGTTSVQQISGIIDGVKVQVIDTPGLKTSAFEQGFNHSVLSSVNKFTNKNIPDVVFYVDRLDAQSCDLNNLPLLKTVTNVLDSSIWEKAKVILTHSASAPPDGPSGAPLSYEVYASQRSNIVQQSIGHAVDDLQEISPNLMNPVSLVENHPHCWTNWEGQKTPPSGQIQRPQVLLLCYSMKILSEASSVSKQQDPFDLWRLFGFARSCYKHLSSLLRPRPHPQLCPQPPLSPQEIMNCPPSFHGDDRIYRDCFLLPISCLNARPVLESHGWDHDCGYDGLKLNHDLEIAGRFPVAYRVKITKDKKDFRMNLDSSISAKHGEKVSSMVGFDVEATGKKLASIILRAETKFKNLKRNEPTCGASFTFLRNKVVPGVKVEDEISLEKQFALVGRAGAMAWRRHEIACGANFYLQRWDLDNDLKHPILRNVGMSLKNLLGGWVLDGLVELAIGNNSEVVVDAWINDDLLGKVSVTTRICEHLSLVVLAAAVIPGVLYRQRKVRRDSGGNR